MADLRNGPENGSMANNMDEVKTLGKQMERMRDNKGLEENNRVADPAQTDDAAPLKKREDN